MERESTPKAVPPAPVTHPAAVTPAATEPDKNPTPTINLPAASRYKAPPAGLERRNHTRQDLQHVTAKQPPAPPPPARASHQTCPNQKIPFKSPPSTAPSTAPQASHVEREIHSLLNRDFRESHHSGHRSGTERPGGRAHPGARWQETSGPLRFPADRNRVPYGRKPPIPGGRGVRATRHIYIYIYIYIHNITTLQNVDCLMNNI